MFSLRAVSAAAHPSSPASRHSPPLEVIDARDALLRVLHELGEEEGERGERDLRDPRLVQVAVLSGFSATLHYCRWPFTNDNSCTLMENEKKDEEFSLEISLFILPSSL